MAENIQANLTVVAVIDEISPNSKMSEHILSPEDFQAKIVIEHLERLKELVAPWGKEIEIKTKVLVGVSFLEIIHEVLRNGHDLLVNMAKSGGFWRQWTSMTPTRQKS